MGERRRQRIPINWRQAAGEAVLLLAGVLLALAGQAWWEARAEQRAVREHVDNLLIELRENRGGLEFIVGRHNLQVEHCVRLLTLIRKPGASAEDDREVVALLRKVLFFDDLQPATSALQNLVNAGDASLLGQADLQLAVSRYEQAMTMHTILQRELAQFVLNPFTETLGMHVSLIDAGFVPDDVEMPIAARTPDVGTLRGEVTVENILARRITAERDARQFAERLVTRIDELVAALTALE